MTPQETIKNLKKLKSFHNGSYGTAIDLAIKALEQQPCEDCISRAEALKAIEKEKQGWEGSERYAIDECHSRIAELSSVTPKQKVGKWIHREDMDYLDKNKVMHLHFMCQDCGFIHDFIDGHTAQYKYCPNCGSKMEVEE